MRYKILTVAGLLASVVLPAHADLISPASQTMPAWTDGSTFLFPKFDPNLGVLTKVHVWESARVGPIITYFTNPQLPPSNPDVGFGGIASLLGTGPGGHSLYAQSGFSGFDQAPVTIDGSVTISGNTQWTSVLDPFVGVDLWALSFIGYYGFLFEDRLPEINLSVIKKQTDLWASITYEYTPLVVPEPRVYGGVVGLILIGMWWRARRSQKTSL